ncbi:TonB-dependent receptor [Emcibacter nanhaiensis]|uniref:TonB-dependent receptor n=1 Tax=Emcibacter nanhaiensis TaxID=1505037 RepID=A0A501PFX7_9PROT|nr:TonB-dependent receptor [Emcibacter nanhaiensis]TPD58891.1 TonB-dependent receptor [Emcibacter nanhaiensis]
MAIFETSSVRNMTKGGLFATAAVLPFVTGVSLASVAQAAEETADRAMVLEEITVTARKRSETLQDTPVSVTAFTGNNMEARGFTDVSQISDFTPNVQFDSTAPLSGGSNAATIFIRGVGQTDFNHNVDPGVGVYIDGVYLARSVGSVLGLLDVERIEVLRGPQGTLFGKNTIGGAVNVTTRKPGGEFEGKLNATYGRFDRFQINGMINIPLNEDKLALRLSGSTESQDAIAYRADGVGLGGKNNDGARATLYWDASDNLDVTLSADYTTADEDSPVESLLGINPAAQLIILNNAFVATDPSGIFDDRFVIDSLDVGGVMDNGTSEMVGSRYEIYGLSMTLNWNVAGIDVKSITAYRNMDMSFGRDADHSPLVIQGTSNDIEHDQFSQEFNLTGTALDDKLDWLLGALYFEEQSYNYSIVPIVPGLFQNPGLEAMALSLPDGPDKTMLLGIVNGGASGGGPDSIDNKSYAAFLHTSYHFTDEFTLTAGLRYTHEKKYVDVKSSFYQLLELLPEGAPVPDAFRLLTDTDDEKEFDNLSLHLNLEYRWNDDVLTYLSYSEGFKSGGFNARYLSPRPAPISFDEEEVTTYEFGVKSELLEHRLRLNIAAFYSDYTNIQVSAVQNGEPFTQNAASATIKGFELEFTALPMENLTLMGGIGYLDAGYDSLDPGTLVTLDDMFVDTPEWSVNVAAEYTVPLGDTAELVFRGDYSYRSKFANDATNTPQLIQDGYGLLNGGITLDFVEKGLSVTAYGRNLTDEHYIMSGWADIGSIGLIDGTWGRPREWGVTVNYNF